MPKYIPTTVKTQTPRKKSMIMWYTLNHAKNRLITIPLPKLEFVDNGNMVTCPIITIKPGFIIAIAHIHIMCVLQIPNIRLTKPGFVFADGIGKAGINKTIIEVNHNSPPIFHVSRYSKKSSIYIIVFEKCS